MNLEEVITQALNYGGGTYSVVRHITDDIEFTSVDRDYGFFVSRKGGIELLPVLSFEVLREFVAGRLLDGEHKGGFLGLWQDDDGLWSVDVTVWSGDLDEALAFGKANNQRAIYALGVNRTIAV